MAYRPVLFLLPREFWTGVLALTLLSANSSVEAGRRFERTMETTAYCGCGKCCSWERGSWKYLKLDRWNRYVSAGNRKGRPYDGKTAAGEEPVEFRPGLFSLDSLRHPWKIPFRVAIPPLILPQGGTIAADTNYYPFGTRIKIPGYGWGKVTDRGGAIKGPDRLDLYFDDHDEALDWGRQTLSVTIELPD